MRNLWKWGALALVGVLLVLGSVLRAWPVASSADAAAWIQALGSILAIVAAFVVAALQANQQRRDRRLDDADRVAERFAPATTLAEEAARELQELRELKNTYPMTPMGSMFMADDQQRQRDRLARIVSAVTRLDPVQMPSGTSVSAVLEVVNAVLEAQAFLQSLPGGRPAPLTARERVVEAAKEERFRRALQRIYTAKDALETEKARLTRLD